MLGLPPKPSILRTTRERTLEPQDHDFLLGADGRNPGLCRPWGQCGTAGVWLTSAPVLLCFLSCSDFVSHPLYAAGTPWGIYIFPKVRSF